MAVNTSEITKGLIDLLKQSGHAELANLQSDSVELNQCISESLARISASVGQPGYQEGLIAERDIVATKAAGIALDHADATDARVLGIIEGVLGVGVKLLAVA